VYNENIHYVVLMSDVRSCPWADNISTRPDPTRPASNSGLLP